MAPLRPTQPLAVRSFAVSAIGLALCVALASARLRGLLLNSTLLAAGTLVVSLPLGTLLAVAVVKTSMPGRRLVEGLLGALLFIPLYVHAAAWQAALGHGGWLVTGKGATIWFTGWTASIWVHGFAAIPWVVLFVAAALRSVRPELEEESLQDASSWQVLKGVSLRGALSGIIAAALWVAVICFGEIAVTDLFQVRTFAEEIYTAANLGVLASSTGMAGMVLEDVPQLANGDLWVGTGVVVALVLAALAAVWSWLPATDAVSTSAEWVWELRSGRWGVALATGFVIVGMVGVPAASLLSKAGATTEQVDNEIVRGWSAGKSGKMVVGSFWEHRREWGWSLAIGSVAVVAATLVGGVLAWALRKGSLPMLPITLLLALGLSVPGPLLAVWLIGILNHPDDSMLWPLTWCYNHTILAPTLVQFFRALPLATLLMWSQFASVSQDVLDSAASEGAGWWRQLLAIVLPLRWAAVVAAAGMAMIVAVGDLTATLLVAPPGVSTLPMRIFGLLHYGSEDRVSALCLALALAVGVVAIFVGLVFRANARQSRSVGAD
ncbi:MAG: iron ABC transporter permease [Planctomycetes bacterium]|nr:iron ABC transporter permease [Planctomycetota bacterium]